MYQPRKTEELIKHCMLSFSKKGIPGIIKIFREVPLTVKGYYAMFLNPIQPNIESSSEKSQWFSDNSIKNFIDSDYPYLPTPLFGQDMTQGQFLSEV